ncbi:GNAT family N-acetyltransferase [Nocardia sp. NPDC055321]
MLISAAPAVASRRESGPRSVGAVGLYRIGHGPDRPSQRRDCRNTELGLSDPFGPSSTVEDGVVDAAARGQGIGAVLLGETKIRAAAAGARTLDLTSRPSRTAADRLYEHLGFRARESQVYRFVPAD